MKETDPEDFAEQHAQQWLGCIVCKQSHHKSSFCKKCGRCFYTQESVQDPELGTIVFCICGQNDLWD